MAESVIFNSPVLLGGFVIALVLLLFELRTESTGYILPVLSVLLSVGVTVYLVLAGGSLQELAIVLMVFIIVNIVAFKHGEGGEK